MSDYSYLVFPYGKQPTVDEAAELKNLSGVLGGKIAVGNCRKTGSLAIAFEATVFDQAMATHRGFANLVQKWKVRGGSVVDRLGFVKDAAALQPAQSGPWGPSGTVVEHGTKPGAELVAKERAAREAVARSLLSVQQTLERYSALRCVARRVPYLLMALGALGVLAAGFYTGRRLLDTGAENRRATIVRVIDAPLEEPLNRRPAGSP